MQLSRSQQTVLNRIPYTLNAKPYTPSAGLRCTSVDSPLASALLAAPGLRLGFNFMQVYSNVIFLNERILESLGL